MSSFTAPVARLWRRRALWRYAPLYAALGVAALVARCTTGAWPRRDRSRTDAPGLSVVVPERGTPELLAETLDALFAALANVAEPSQVIVVVNGAARDDYATLCAKYPNIEWRFHAAPLGYNGAIVDGLSRARHAWTYLLNSDMRLDPGALAALLPYRQPNVFAITSQIFFVDTERRREETGWADFVWNPATPEVTERTPEASELARGNLYPGGGSSLCRTRQLRRYAAASRDYAPFYWEDADWGAAAWSDGYEVLFCPTSHAWHHHRGTVKRYYDAAEVERIVRRNALLFDLRRGFSALGPADLMHRVATADPATQAELKGLGLAWRVFRARCAMRRAVRRGLRVDRIAADRWYGRPRNDATPRPRVLLVSPFALFPPAHGGARRIAELVTRLADRVDFILLGDERSLYDAAAEPWFAQLHAVHLVEGRGDRPGEAPLSLGERIERHAWPRLRAETRRLVALYDPDIVQVEFMELARLAEERDGRARWLLALHDVYLGSVGPADDLHQQQLLRRYDALTACSTEDVALLKHPRSALIGNGAVDRRATYAPSPQSPPRLLFMGPFRYAQNRDGILEFLDTCWAPLRAQVPDLQLTILGGPEAAADRSRDARLTQPGVDLVCAFVDPAPHLAAATLTINPQRDIRGSSIKLIESLLAGRICVSTADGARGFGGADLKGLVVADDIAAMAEAIAPLLRDAAVRHARETGDPQLDAHTWDAMAERQLALYRALL